MFHNAQFCPARRKLIQHLLSIKANTSTVPFSYLGLWMVQAAKIPQEALDEASIVGGLSDTFRKQMRVDRSGTSTQLTLAQFTSSDAHKENLEGTTREKGVAKDLTIFKQGKGNFIGLMEAQNEERGVLAAPPQVQTNVSSQTWYNTSCQISIDQKRNAPALEAPQIQQQREHIFTSQLPSQHDTSSLKGALITPTNCKIVSREEDHEIFENRSTYINSKQKTSIKRAAHEGSERAFSDHDDDARKVRFKSAPPQCSDNLLYLSFDQDRKGRGRDKYRKFKAKHAGSNSKRGEGNTQWDKRGPTSERDIVYDSPLYGTHCHNPSSAKDQHAMGFSSTFQFGSIDPGTMSQVVHPTATSLAEQSKVNQTTGADQHAEWVQNMIVTPNTLDRLAETNDDTEVGNIEDMEHNMSPSSLQAAAPAFKAPLSQ
jgi:hypothetical protein